MQFTPPPTSRKPLVLEPCPQEGVHFWIMATANRCAYAGVPPDEAERIIRAGMTRPPSPANEVQTAVQKAYRECRTRSSSPRYSFPIHQGQRARPTVALDKIKFDPAKLAAIASRITAPSNWRHWLWERSPKRPETQNAFSFLAHLYRPGEKVLVFDIFETKKPLGVVTITEPMDCRVPDLIRKGGRYGFGVWFLCNPVDGKWHDMEKPAPAKKDFSCRDWHAVTSWRYAVLESDQADPTHWLAFVAQLPVRVAAIYTSGGRSVHALLRLDAGTKQEWDEAVAPLKRPFRAIGADSGALSAVRLTRLPGCWRPEKRGFQRLLYLNPNPPDVRLLDVPIRATRSESLTRWKNICPRWNSDKEAFQ